MNTDGDERPRRGTRFGWLLVCLILLVVLAFVITPTVRVFFPPATTPYHPGRFFLFFFPFGILIFCLIVFAIARMIFRPWGRGIQESILAPPQRGSGDREGPVRKRKNHKEIIRPDDERPGTARVAPDPPAFLGSTPI